MAERQDTKTTVYYIDDPEGETKIVESRGLTKTVITCETGSKHTMLEIDASGKVFLNGSEVVVRSTYIPPLNGLQLDQLIQPRMSTWVYSETPFYSGGSYSIDGGRFIVDIEDRQDYADMVWSGFLLFIASKAAALPALVAIIDRGALALDGLKYLFKQLQGSRPDAKYWFIEEQIWYNTYTQTSPKVIRYTKHDYNYYYDYINDVLTGYVSSDVAYGKLTYQT